MNGTKEVYQMDAAGFLVGPAPADRLNDGTWQIPAGCVTAKPPMARAGHRRQWNGRKWIQVADGGANV